MSFAVPRYVYDDYKLWKGDWELLDGYPLAMAPSPFGKHQKIVRNLINVFSQLLEDCEDCDVYPKLDWIVDESNVFRPDLAIYCEDVEEYPKTTPKIIVEVVSSSTAKRDEVFKFDKYEEETVGYYILAYPDFKKVRVFKLTDGKYKKVYEGDSKYKFEFCNMEVDFKRAF